MASPDTTARPSAVQQQTSETPTPKKPRRLRARGQRGSIYRRGKSWVIVYRTAERRQKAETHPTKDAAQARLTEVIRLIKENRFIDAKPALFSAFTDDWLKRRQSTMKPGTWRSYKSALDKWLVPEFGEYEMNQITRPMVKAFGYKLLDKDLAGKSVQNFLHLLHGIFEEGIDAEVCAANPAHKLKIKFPDDSEARAVPSKADLLATLAHLGATPVYQALLAAAALTGCRRGELCGLLWSEVDWLARTIHIERSLVRIHQERAGSHKNLVWICSAAFACAAPKSKKGRRTIVMVPQLANPSNQELLQSLRHQRPDSSRHRDKALYRSSHQSRLFHSGLEGRSGEIPHVNSRIH